ncbi:excisionase family DNA-binding protein [Lysobacter korlensis]|uniref:Excisionase family DNA-binding protein n=1 Tax=Lysobacter korlensis TaxID=553636 RepID=A0ABV6RSR7_9GAMM
MHSARCYSWTSVTPASSRCRPALPSHRFRTGAKARRGEARWPTTRATRDSSLAELATLMRVSNMTGYRLVHPGDLPAVRFGRSFRIPESAVLAAIQTPRRDVG